jgi:hypothetical protein
MILEPTLRRLILRPIRYPNTSRQGSLLQASRAAYHKPFTLPNALKICAFILYMDELETAPPKAYSKPLGRLKTGFRGSPTHKLPRQPDIDPSGTYHRPSGQLYCKPPGRLKTVHPGSPTRAPRTASYKPQRQPDKSPQASLSPAFRAA